MWLWRKSVWSTTSRTSSFTALMVSKQDQSFGTQKGQREEVILTSQKLQSPKSTRQGGGLVWTKFETLQAQSHHQEKGRKPLVKNDK